MNKREQIKKYFEPFPKWAVWITIIGIPFLYLLFSRDFADCFRYLDSRGLDEKTCRRSDRCLD